MTDHLSTIINEAVRERLTPEFVEKEVNSRVDRLVVEAVDSALRNYSKTGEAVRKAVEDALRVDRLDLPSYGSVVTAMLKKQIDSRMSELVAGRLAQDMEDLLQVAPKEIKLSEIADGMRKRHSDLHGEAWGPVISVVVEWSNNVDGFCRIGLDEDVADKRRLRDCACEIAVDSDGKIYSASLEGRTLDSTVALGRQYGIGQLIRAWYACGTRIIIDEDAVVTSEGDY